AGAAYGAKVDGHRERARDVRSVAKECFVATDNCTYNVERGGIWPAENAAAGVLGRVVDNRAVADSGAAARTDEINGAAVGVAGVAGGGAVGDVQRPAGGVTVDGAAEAGAIRRKRTAADGETAARLNMNPAPVVDRRHVADDGAVGERQGVVLDEEAAAV